jgi:hypothetical protein
MSYKPTKEALPIKINLNKNIGLFAKSLQINVNNIEELEWPIEVCVKMDKDSWSKLMNQ